MMPPDPAPKGFRGGGAPIPFGPVVTRFLNVKEPAVAKRYGGQARGRKAMAAAEEFLGQEHFAHLLIIYTVILGVVQGFFSAKCQCAVGRSS